MYKLFLKRFFDFWIALIALIKDNHNLDDNLNWFTV